MALFHIYDSVCRDERCVIEDDMIEIEYFNAESDNDSEYDEPKRKPQANLQQGATMVIHLFGMTPTGESARIDITGFRPFFYVSYPPTLHSHESVAKEIVARLGRQKKRVSMDMMEFKVEYKKELYGYNGGKTSRFLRISFQSLAAFYEVRKLFLDDKQRPCFSVNRGKPLDVYESNIDPMLRFFHMRSCNPCGWITADGDEIESDSGTVIRCAWTSASPADAPPAMLTAPFVHAFWDVECYSESGDFPQAKKVCVKGTSCGKCANCKSKGDPIIQIGTTLWSHAGLLEKHIFVLEGCSPVDGVIVHTYTKEAELLRAWFTFVIERNVNIFIGYNIFGFDERYVWERLCKLGIDQDDSVQQLSRLHAEGRPMKLEEKRLTSSALGDNFLYMWTTPGRLRIDLLGHIKRKAQLPSYKLDSVAAVYLSGKLSGIQKSSGNDTWLLLTKQKGDARVGRSVQVLDELGEELTDKMEVLEVVSNGILVSSEEELTAIAGEAARWAVVKDDVSPQQIFKFHRGSDADRGVVAAYCVQDCDLTLELYKKLDVFNEAMSMANVCSVPVSYIFTRGQGIKIESLIFKYCMMESGQLIKVLPSSSGNEESYEGAIVLDPVPGFYTESPVGVCDFASLYPSTIISENISHDMLVWAKDYDLEGKLVAVSYGSVEAEKEAPEGTAWTDIEFDILRPDPEDTRKHPVKKKDGTRLCRFAQPAKDVKGSMPLIVAKLLAARKAKREEIKKTDDPFKKALLDAEQNAYKITANSLYGQLGSPTFKIRLQNLAASVTAYGRKQIMFSKAAIEQFYGPGANDPRCSAEIVYGDTDSIFVNFNPRGTDGSRLTGREAVVATQHLTEEVGKFITGTLKAPHDFEYDKTFYPFIIFSKKRYVGNKYEDDPDEFKETSMGIVLKRRDNAPLLKMTYGSAIDRLLNHRDVAGAVKVVKDYVKELVEGRMKLSQLTITKSLRSQYKTTPPAHKVLADRIAVRDPGNAPASGERIGYVYVKALVGQQASKLQGDRVETPSFIAEKGLKPDAEYYILHQLMNPLAQLFGLMVEKMPGFTGGADVPVERREMIASDILFKEGLMACKNAATRAFIQKMSGGSAGHGVGGSASHGVGGVGGSSNSSKPIVLRPPPPPDASLEGVDTTTLTNKVKELTYIGDQRMARSIRAVRQKAKQSSMDSFLVKE